MITIAWVPRRVTDVVLGLMTRTRVNLRLDDIFVPRPNGRRTEMLAEHKRFLDHSGGEGWHNCRAHDSARANPKEPA